MPLLDQFGSGGCSLFAQSFFSPEMGAGIFADETMEGNRGPVWVCMAALLNAPILRRFPYSTRRIAVIDIGMARSSMQ
jgi:hypothetical protein